MDINSHSVKKVYNDYGNFKYENINKAQEMLVYRIILLQFKLQI